MMTKGEFQNWELQHTRKATYNISSDLHSRDKFTQSVNYLPEFTNSVFTIHGLRFPTIDWVRSRGKYFFFFWSSGANTWHTKNIQVVCLQLKHFSSKSWSLIIPLKQHHFQTAQAHGGKNKHKDDAKRQLSPSDALVWKEGLSCLCGALCFGQQEALGQLHLTDLEDLYWCPCLKILEVRTSKLPCNYYMYQSLEDPEGIGHQNYHKHQYLHCSTISLGHLQRQQFSHDPPTRSNDLTGVRRRRSIARQ